MVDQHELAMYSTTISVINRYIAKYRLVNHNKFNPGEKYIFLLC